MDHFLKDRCTYIAAALTFTSLLALVPLMAVIFSILRLFPTYPELSDTINQFVFSNFVPASSNVIQSHLESFVNQTTKLTIVGSVLLFVTALMTLSTIENAFNYIWNIKRKRGGISAIILYWAVLTMAPILIVLSLLVTSYLASLPFITETATTLGFSDYLLVVMPFVLTTIAFILLYIAVPNCRVRFKHGLIGGLVASVLFEITKHGFSIYIQLVPTYELIYGTLAAIPIFLLWVYISWLIILLGAELANALRYNHHKQVGIISDLHFVVAYYWLGYLWQAQQKGEGLSLAKLLHLHGKHAHIDIDALITCLIDAKLIRQLDNGHYVLLRDLSNFSLEALYHVLPWKLPYANQLQAQTHVWGQHLAGILKGTDEALHVQLQQPLAKIYQVSQT